MSLLPVMPAHALAVVPETRRWLIRDLWSAEAVGIVGGEPKCCKSFLALDMAVAVASGKPCLRRFPVAEPGRVLLYAAEDALHIVRRRLDGIAAAAGADLATLDLQVITADSLRLDVAGDRARLLETVEAMSPRLLVLDPFVRLHRVDENASGEVAPLLAHLRDLQRRFRLAVAVVHHSRKGAGKTRAGQALRGSSEFHAWGDSNLYLRRLGERLLLSVEHRAAASIEALGLTLCSNGDRLALEITRDLPAAETTAPPLTPAQRVEHALADAAEPLPLRDLRRACRIRTAHLCDALAGLVREGRVTKTAAGYTLAHAEP